METTDNLENENELGSERAGIRSADLDELITNEFKGRVVRKYLTKQLKAGANGPV